MGESYADIQAQTRRDRVNVAIPLSPFLSFPSVCREAANCMDGLLLTAGAFLIWAVYCAIAWATGYSPERSVRQRAELCEEILSDMEARLEQLSIDGEIPLEARGD